MFMIFLLFLKKNIEIICFSVIMLAPYENIMKTKTIKKQQQKQIKKINRYMACD